MDAKIKRPPSVWIVQIFLILYGVLFTFASIADWSYFEPSEYYSWEMLIVAAETVVAIFLFLAFIGATVRWRWSRVFVVAALSSAFVWLAVLIIKASLSGDPETALPSDPIVLVGYFGGSSLVMGLLAILALTFILNKRVQPFFNPPVYVESEFTTPPAPPTFDS